MSKLEFINRAFKGLSPKDNPLLITDGRSLSLFRILLGISILYNLIVIKVSYLHELIGSKALFTVEEWKFLNGSNALNFFYFIHADWFVTLVLSISILLAFLFTLGFYSQIVSILLFFLLYNIQSSVSAFINGYDFYTQHLLFFSIFLPLDNHFSILKRFKLPNWNTTVNKYFSIAILFQISLVYFNTGIVKSGISWHNGYAIKMMSMDLWNARFFSDFLVNNDLISYFLNYFTLLFECFSPILIFVPIRKFIGRYVIVITLVLFHISVFFTLDVANFSITGLAAAAVLLPSTFWETKFLSFKSESNGTASNTPSKVFLYVVVILLLYKSLFFWIQWGPFRSEEWNYKLYKSSSAYNIQNPLKLSILTQNWKMFAPNPPVRVGWFTIEEVGDDGLLYDFFTHEIVNPHENVLRYKPSGMLMQILSNSREYDYDDCWRQRFFLKKWIHKNLYERYGSDYLKNKIFFADYQSNIKIDRMLVDDPVIQKKLITIDAIYKLPIKVSESDTSQTP